MICPSRQAGFSNKNWSTISSAPRATKWRAMDQFQSSTRAVFEVHVALGLEAPQALVLPLQSAESQGAARHPLHSPGYAGQRRGSPVPGQFQDFEFQPAATL